MTMSNRRAARHDMPIRVFRLGEEPPDDLAAVMSVHQRLDLVAELSRCMWALTGRPVPTYPRGEMPVRVIRPG